MNITLSEYKNKVETVSSPLTNTGTSTYVHQHTEAQRYMREHTKYVCVFGRTHAAESYMDEHETKYSKPLSAYMNYLRDKLPALCGNSNTSRDTVAAFDTVIHNLNPEDFDASGSCHAQN